MTSDTKCVATKNKLNLASGGNDKQIKIWNASTGACVSTLLGHTGPVFKLVALPNGDLASASSDKTIRIWDVENCLCSHFFSSTNAIFSLALMQNGNLVSGNTNGHVEFWDVNNKKKIQEIDASSYTVHSLYVLPNGDLACGYSNGMIRIWGVVAAKSDNIKLENICETIGDNIKLENICETKGDATTASVVSAASTRKQNYELKHTLVGHSNSVRQIGILQNGRLISTSRDGTLKTWDLSTGKPVQTFCDIKANSFVVTISGRLVCVNDEKLVTYF